MRIALLFLLSLVISCNSVTKPKDNVFIVPSSYKIKVDSIKRGLLNEPPPPPPPPPPPFYQYYHFIADSAGQLFYYQLGDRGRYCRNGEDYDLPFFIGLKPNDLVRIPINSVQQFIKLNILNQDTFYRKVIVGLLRDTIISDGLVNIREIIKADSSKAAWYHRKATLEEFVVLDYKKKQKEYNPDEIKWDSTKIVFVHTPRLLKD